MMNELRVFKKTTKIIKIRVEMDQFIKYTVLIVNTVFDLRTITIYILFIFLYDRLSVQISHIS